MFWPPNQLSSIAQRALTSTSPDSKERSFSPGDIGDERDMSGEFREEGGGIRDQMPAVCSAVRTPVRKTFLPSHLACVSSRPSRPMGLTLRDVDKLNRTTHTEPCVVQRSVPMPAQ